jgi:septal ring factor EnvC (AmiA/AmiB activator)
MTNTKTRSPRRPVLPDELRGHITDVLALRLSNSQTTAAVLSRVNGTALNDVLAAALAVAREQVGQRIAELESELAEKEDECSQLAGELQDLRHGLKNLLEEGG